MISATSIDSFRRQSAEAILNRNSSVIKTSKLTICSNTSTLYESDIGDCFPFYRKAAEMRRTFSIFFQIECVRSAPLFTSYCNSLNTSLIEIAFLRFS